MQSYEWILSVLDDLGTFAENQELEQLAQKVREAKLKASEEIKRKSRSQPDVVE